MSDSEEDYMSEKYLIQAEQHEKKQPQTYSERRKQATREHERKAYIAPRAQMEKKAREEGLNQSVSEDNKGMQMLMKMGFKKGMALGKSGDGMTTPIAVEMKQGRGGIGTKRALEEEAKEQEAKRPNIDPEEYRELMAQRVKEAQRMRRSRAAASLIEKLDKDKGIEMNILWIFNIPEKTEDEQGNHEQEKDNDEVSGEDDKAEEEPLPYPEEEMEALKALPLEERLERLVSYLRNEHTYCFWCAVKYNDQQDLDENCPGPEEDDH
ncbi:coiled-coil domain-containing protein 75 [Lichtheimia corymbifera JMRC:FSU:9682]|uniref:Coiled-coil domain-containing protein 75 n=1 Tax=Lichtheimia corymbifera JMRC:FSU:9682 TaxID=1263082 RepID=A0A068RH07_9FUNG|nr:coiled-coil domain-containing protein 75 [Lichtheimia corymbifera JMRC:FSU:9682]